MLRSTAAGVADSTQGHDANTVTATNVSSKGNSWAAAALIGDSLTFSIVNGSYDGTGRVLGLDLSNGSQGSVSGAEITTGSTAGIAFHGAHDVIVSDTNITGSSSAANGISDDGLQYGVGVANNITLNGNTISGVASGILGNGGSNWTVDGGSISAATAGSGTGVSFKNLTGTNSIKNVDGISNFATGILADNVEDLTIQHNTITGTSGNGMTLTNDYGNGSTVWATNVSYNTLSGIGADGIDVNGGAAIIYANDITSGNGKGNGVFLDHVGNSLVGDKYTGDGNTITGFNIGVKVDGGRYTPIGGNIISTEAIGSTGIFVTNSDSTDIGYNVEYNAVSGYHTGIALDTVKKVSVNNNTIDHVKLLSTTFESTWSFTKSEGRIITGTLSGNIVEPGTGIDLKNSSHLGVTNNSITAEGPGGFGGNGGTGIHLVNVSNSDVGGVKTVVDGDSNTTVSLGNDIHNFGIGISLEGGLIDGILGQDTPLLTPAGSHDLTIQNNIMDGAIFGISVQLANNITVTGNELTAFEMNNDYSIGVDFNFVSGANSIDHNSITNFTKGIVLNASNGPSVSNSVVANSIYGSATGIQISEYHNESALEVSGNSIYSQTTGIDVSNSDNISLSGNHLFNTGDSTGINISGGSFITADGNDIHSFNTGISAVESDNLTLTNNSITRADTGILVDSSTGATTISGNTINNKIDVYDGEEYQYSYYDHSGTGIHLVNTADAQVSYNQVYGTNRGIWNDGSNGTTITAGTLYENTTAVRINPSVGVTVDSVYIGGGTTGIEVLDSGNTTIKNNSIQYVAGKGISLSNSGGVDGGRTVIDNNVIYSTGDNAIDVSESAFTTIKRNFIGFTDRIGTAGDVNNIGGDAIHVDASDFVKVRSNQITEAAENGISVTNSSGVTIGGSIEKEGNTISNVGNDGIFGQNLSTDANGRTVISFNSIDTAGHDGINLHGITNALIDSNHISFVENDGISATDLSIAFAKSYKNTGDATAVFDSNIVNNRVNNAGRDGIHLRGVENANVVANTVQTAGRDGIHARDLSVNAIVEKIKGGRRILDQYSDITGNTIYDATRDGIHLNGASNANVSGNFINNTGRDGINASRLTVNRLSGNLDEVAQSTIEGNHINLGDGNLLRVAAVDAPVNYSSGRDGIHLDRVENAQVSENTIRNADRDGINAANLTVSSDAMKVYGERLGSGPISNQKSIVESNDIGNSSRDGINLNKVVNANISDNTINDTGRDGINVRNFTVTKLVSNVITFAKSIVSGNRINVPDEITLLAAEDAPSAVIHTSGRDGIHLDSVANASVTGNTIRNVDNDGINATNLTVSEASLSPIVESVLTFDGDSIVGGDIAPSMVFGETLVASNNILGAGHDGIHVDGSVNTSIVDNDVVNAVNNGIFANNLTVQVSDAAVVVPTLIESSETPLLTRDLSHSLIAQNRVSIGTNGIVVSASPSVDVNTNTVHDVSDLAISLTNSGGTADVHSFVRNNTVFNSDGVAITSSDYVDALNNTITDGDLAVDSSAYLLADLNTLSGGSILLTGSTNATITNNGITNGNISLTDSSGADVHDNTLTDGDILFVGSADGRIVHNILTGGSINVDTSDNAVVNLNDVSGESEAAGITVSNSANATVTNNNVINRAIGYVLSALKTVLFSGNTADGNTTGVQATDVADGTYSDNQILNSTGTGFEGVSLTNASFTGNTFGGNATGVSITDSTGVGFLGNSYLSNGIGARISGTNNATFSGEIFTGNTLGLDLNNSKGTRIEESSFTIPGGGIVTEETPVGGIGLTIRNGSSGTIVKNVTFTNGLAAVVIDGAESDMQFEGNNSKFVGNDFHFILQNDGMAGQTLDASQQFFDGTRASEFSIDQYVQAEGRTIDNDDNTVLGDVFYINVTDDSVLEQVRRNRAGLYRGALFSYAGRTLASDIARNSFSFRINEINLSLLNQANPLGATANIANRFANLAPAAGGNNSGQSGGANAVNFAKLSSAAGGNTQPSFGNDFLGQGFKPGFGGGSAQ